MEVYGRLSPFTRGKGRGECRACHHDRFDAGLGRAGGLGGGEIGARDLSDRRRPRPLGCLSRDRSGGAGRTSQRTAAREYGVGGNARDSGEALPTAAVVGRRADADRYAAGGYVGVGRQADPVG